MLPGSTQIPCRHRHSAKLVVEDGQITLPLAISGIRGDVGLDLRVDCLELAAGGGEVPGVEQRLGLLSPAWEGAE